MHIEKGQQNKKALKKLENFPTLKEIEQKSITKALAKTRGNKTNTARILGISRYTLYRKIKNMNIE